MQSLWAPASLVSWSVHSTLRAKSTSVHSQRYTGEMREEEEKEEEVEETPSSGCLTKPGVYTEALYIDLIQSDISLIL